MGVRRSTYYAFGTRHANVLIHFIGIAIIARLLTPAEIGVFTVSAAFVMLSQILRDFGIGSYLIQARELDRPRICSAMGVGLLIGGALTVLICLLAWPLAIFYDQPGVADVLYIQSATFLLMPIHGISLALLKRNLEFGQAFWFETASSLAWAGTAITLAYLGFSYYSLAWSSLSGSILMLLLVAAVRRDVILFRPSLAHWRAVVGFGSVVAAANLITQIGVLAPAIVMGRMLGFSDVAFYNRGHSVTRMFRDTVEKGSRAIALPAFAAQLRDDAFSKESYLYGATLITGISWPFFCGLALMAYPVVRILFGDQWDAAVPVLQYLAVSNIIMALVIMSSEVMVAVGAVKYVLHKALIIQSTRIAIVVACSFYSFEAVAAGQIAVGVIAVAVSQFYLRRAIGLGFRDLVMASMPSAAVTAVSMIGPVLVALFYPPGPGLLWPPLVLAVASGGIGWLVAVFAVGHPVRNEIMILFRKTRSLVASPHRV